MEIQLNLPKRPEDHGGDGEMHTHIIIENIMTGL